MAKQIMIVDDDRNILEFMQLALSFEGYDVHTSTSGSEIRQGDPGELPDLILLDVKLVEEDGRAICQQLKSNKQTRDVPIIMISAHVSERKLREDCPADDVLIKPFDLDSLIGKVETQLAKHN